MLSDIECKIEQQLEKWELNPVERGHYWLIRCPYPERHNHGDKSPSVQCFKDGWIECHSGCGRFHINQVCKERGEPMVMPREQSSSPRQELQEKTERKPKEVYGDFTQLWLELEPLPSTMEVKGVSGVELNKRGWRQYPGGNGVKPGIFIPYFTMDRKTVCFYQVRHLQGERRFTFAPGYTPTLYGLENLPLADRFVAYTEGSRDAVILNMVGVPAVALPSASSGTLLKKLCDYCSSHSLTLLAVCDRDDAGDALVRDLTCPAMDLRTPVGKDVGEFFEQKGIEEVRKYYAPFAVKEEDGKEG